MKICQSKNGIKYFSILLLFYALVGCNVRTYSGKLHLDFTNMGFLSGWEEIKSSIPALQKGEVFLVYLYNNYTIDQSGNLLSFSFDIIVDEYTNKQKNKIYNVNIKKNHFTVSYKGKEQLSKNRLPINGIMIALDQLPPPLIIEMIPEVVDEYFIYSHIIHPGELISRQYINFDLPSYQVDDSVVIELEEPFIANKKGIILYVVPINCKPGEKPEYGQEVLHLLLNFQNP